MDGDSDQWLGDGDRFNDDVTDWVIRFGGSYETKRFEVFPIQQTILNCLVVLLETEVT